MVLFLIVMYVVPEFLKRRKKKQPYQYPDVPPQGFPGESPRPVGIPGSLSRGIKPPPVPLQVTEGVAGDEGKAGDEGDPNWGLQPMQDVPVLAGEITDRASLDPAMAGTAIVWAEVIAPPVALRLARGQRRRF